MGANRRWKACEREAALLWLETLREQYHRRTWLGSDPLQFVHRYRDPDDQEIIGLLAASLAYGNVAVIHRSMEEVVRRMVGLPAAWLRGTGEREIRHAVAGFRHRWTDEVALGDLLVGMARAIRSHGSLGSLFRELDQPGDDYRNTLTAWVKVLRGAAMRGGRHLLADPAANSPCKRLYLYARWMIRRDEIDPGCWTGLDPARLVIPLDTHIFAFAKAARFTRRARPDGRAALEITHQFRLLRPDDPVRYDFALTRPGILHGWRPGTRPPWSIHFDTPDVHINTPIRTV